MGIRAGGDPLTAVVPDLEQLAKNPREYLTEGPLLFGPRRFLGLAALFGVPGLVLFISWRLAPAETERLALAVALLLGSALWLLRSLVTVGHSLYLGPDGVEIRYGDTTVYCPWDLFDSDGEPWSGGQHDSTAGLALPVVASVVPLVVWRRGVIELARGANIRAPQAWFLSPGELILPGRYELNSDDLGKLLLLLGAKLSGRVPARDLQEQSEAYAVRDRATDRPASSYATQPPTGVSADKDGFYAVSLARFQLPPCCIVCAGEPEATLVLTLRGSGGAPLTVEMPICQGCRTRELSRTNGILTGWGLGMAIVGLLGGLLAPEESRVSATLCGGMLAGLFGLFIGGLVGMPRPIEIRDHDPASGTLRIRFRNEAVEKMYRERRARS